MKVAKEMKGDFSDSLMQIPAKTLDDGYATEVLLDAYRRVALSHSKTIGTRVVALLTARLLIEKRDANSAEETMTDIAAAK